MNSYFQFKQFTIHQEQCAQKVSEVACLFGAWIKLPSKASTLLDIGAGSGLLSLMISQRHPHVSIDALEMNEDTYTQLVQNITASPFSECIQAICADVRTFESEAKYDAIVVNPPFHEKQLKSSGQAKNQAWHSDTLTLLVLIQAIDRLLSEEGEAFILLPSYRIAELQEVLHSNHLFLSQTVGIAHSKEHEEKITMLKLVRNVSALHHVSLIIKQNGEYTDEVRALFAPYYLTQNQH